MNRRSGAGAAAQRLLRLPRCARATLLALCALAAFCLCAWLLLKLLPFGALGEFRRRQCSTRFYDRNGILLQIMSVDDGIRREWTPLEQIPEELQRIFIEAEDKAFYKHRGIHLGAVVRAAAQNLSSGVVVSGASTITMQLARMVVPRKNAAATLGDKLREAFLALRIEAKLDKRQILELYLNNLPFGYRTEGVTSAARNFYALGLHELSAAQMQALAQIPRRPSVYIKNVDGTARFEYPNLAPHFVNYVKGLYAGRGERLPAEMRLSIDFELTEETRLRLFQTALDYSSARIADGAAFVMDNRTGEILVWCGSTDFDRADTGQIDGVLVKNQTGSSTKPFLYASALENGIRPSAVLPDVPSDFGTDYVYVPQNFNNRFNGPQLFRTCLASSLNIPAVYLLYQIGVDRYIETLRHLGFDSLQGRREDLGLSLALGAGEVPLYELGRAFSVFAREGTLPELSVLAQGEGYAAQVLGAVFSPDITRIICDMLSDRDARALGFGFAKVFNTPYPAIFKTGTSNQFQNIVALGSTMRYTVAVWMGNVTGETVIGETGSSIPAGIVRFLLDSLEAEKPLENGRNSFALPEQYQKATVCALSGMACGEACSAAAREFVRKGENLAPCTWHYRDSGGAVRVRYPNEYQRWFGGRNMNGGLSYEGEFSFFYPQNGAIFVYDGNLPQSKQQLRIDVAGGGGELAELLLDGVSCGTSARPFSWYIPITAGTHRLEALSASEYDAITIYVR